MAVPPARICVVGCADGISLGSTGGFSDRASCIRCTTHECTLETPSLHNQCSSRCYANDDTDDLIAYVLCIADSVLMTMKERWRRPILRQSVGSQREQGGALWRPRGGGL